MPAKLFSNILDQVHERDVRQRADHVRQTTRGFYEWLVEKDLAKDCKEQDVSERGAHLMKKLFQDMDDASKFFIHLAGRDALEKMLTHADDTPIPDTLKPVQQWLTSDAMRCFKIDGNRLNPNYLLKYLDYVSRAFIETHPDPASYLSGGVHPRQSRP